MTEKPVVFDKDEKGRFVSGNIGGGRPKGSRNKLGEAFTDALYEAKGALTSCCATLAPVASQVATAKTGRGMTKNDDI